MNFATKISTKSSNQNKFIQKKKKKNKECERGIQID